MALKFVQLLHNSCFIYYYIIIWGGDGGSREVNLGTNKIKIKIKIKINQELEVSR